MLFCRSRERVRVELALRLAPGIHSYGPNGVKIGLILPRLFKFSNGVNNDVFLHRFSRLSVFIAMSFVRWCGTADVASPRPREVGGACRRQVLAGARTQETVGGPNGAQRSELRRTAPPDDKRCCDRQMLPWHVMDFRGRPRDMAIRIDFRGCPRLYDIDKCSRSI